MAESIATLAIQLGIIILLARLFGAAATRIRVPAVMGELVAGILFGPYALGGLSLPGFPSGIFSMCNATPGIPLDPMLYSVATLGSIALLFQSGLETDVRTFFRYSVAGTIVGIGGIICSFICGAVVGRFVLGWPFMDPRTLFLGILCTATSVGISARILSEHHAMGSPEGVTIMAAAVIDDVLGIVCLAVVVGIAGVELRGGSMDWGSIAKITVRSFAIWLGFTALGLVFSRQLANLLKRFRAPAAFPTLAFGFALMLAGFFEKAGLAMIVGAFVMGLSLSRTDVAFRIRNVLQPISAFLVPVFFVAMGMLVDVRVLGDPAVLGVGLVFAFMAILGKVVGCSLPSLLMGFTPTGALRVGIGMVPRCEVVLIIAGIAATTMMKDPAGGASPVPIFDSRLFGIAVIMPLVTALVAPPLLGAVLRIPRKGVRHDKASEDQTVTTFDFRTEPIAAFALNEIVELLQHDGFACSSVTRGVRVVQFRKDDISFALEVKGSKFVFTSSDRDVPLIRTSLYESVVELHRSLSELRQLVAPDAVQAAMKTSGGAHSGAPRREHGKDEFPLARVITPRNIVVGLKAKDKAGAIRELLDAMGRNAPLANPDLCYRDVLERDAIVSTYQENGIAMPHARTDGTSSFATAIGISADGIDYDEGAPDHRVNLVILSVCPKDEPGPYLQFIARIARVLSDAKRREAILSARDAAEAARVFTGA